MINQHGGAGFGVEAIVAFSILSAHLMRNLGILAIGSLALRLFVQHKNEREGRGPGKSCWFHWGFCLDTWP